ncbi:hypothetical protein GCM10029992_27090 [Glycomyces albus]
MASYTNRAELPEALTVIASQLEAAGFAVETDVRDYTDIEPDMLAGAFDAFLMSRSVVQDSGDAYTYLESDFTSEEDSTSPGWPTPPWTRPSAPPRP